MQSTPSLHRAVYIHLVPGSNHYEFVPFLATSGVAKEVGATIPLDVFGDLLPGDLGGSWIATLGKLADGSLKQVDLRGISQLDAKKK